uniref:sulfotransferase domain-containing protein n=1 Tax=uncultured Erythrobacter sp. TaxID=263913 RepID=UPI00261CD7BF|nr:sulfotransferase domain-containing protein [uncultured Erythrobacter sp.]
MQNGEIVWLASYPKSGNTWVRLLLGNLLGLKDDDENPGDNFNPVTGISSDRFVFEYCVGLNSYELTRSEIDRVRADVYRMMVRDKPGLKYIKAHDAFGWRPDGKALFPGDCSRGAVYMVRDPMDVAVSYAHHQGHDAFDQTVAGMNDTTKFIGGGRKEQLHQFTGGWSRHYQSWAEQTEMPVCVVRYEDLRADTTRQLSRIAKFIGLEEADFAVSIEEAVEASRFDRLQKIEEEKGFAERPANSKRFFRSGRSGEGRETLPDELQNQIISNHADVMRELGYLERETQ